MTTTHSKIDWHSVRERLACLQTQAGTSGTVSRDQLNNVFRQRAQRLSRRGRENAAQANRTTIIVFRLGSERFGIELTHVKQVFARVPITSIPGACGLLLGVANLNGALRSVVDSRMLLNVAAARSNSGHIVLLRGSGKLLGIWIETLDGVCQVDLDRLVAVNEAASDPRGGLVKGSTDDRILVLDVKSLIERVAESKRLPAKDL